MTKQSRSLVRKEYLSDWKGERERERKQKIGIKLSERGTWSGLAATDCTHDQERVICFPQDAVLGHGVLDLALLDDNFLLEDLDREKLAGSLFAAQNDFPERATSEHFEKLKVLQCLQR